MNNKMTINSQYQQLNLKQKQEQKQTEQTIRTGMESQNWRSHGRLSVGMGRGYGGQEVQGIRIKICRHKIDTGRLRKYRKYRSQRTYMYDTWT